LHVLNQEEFGRAALLVAFTRNPAARDVRYRVETSADLVSWEPLGETAAGIPVEFTVAVPEAAASDLRRFFRLTVELTPVD
jgi:hypothetical protein